MLTVETKIRVKQNPGRCIYFFEIYVETTTGPDIEVGHILNAPSDIAARECLRARYGCLLAGLIQVYAVAELQILHAEEQTIVVYEEAR